MKSTKIKSGVYSIQFNVTDTLGYATLVDLTIQKCSERNVWVMGGYIESERFTSDIRFPEWMTIQTSTKKGMLDHLASIEEKGTIDLTN